VFGVNDKITITFDSNTSVAANTVWNTAQVLANLNPNVGIRLGSGLSATWTTRNAVVISVTNATGVNSFQTCSQLTFRVASAVNLRDTLLRSTASTSQSTAAMASGSFSLTPAAGMQSI